VGKFATFAKPRNVITNGKDRTTKLKLLSDKFNLLLELLADDNTLADQERKFSFFAYALLKRKTSPHYSTLPCAHSPPPNLTRQRAIIFATLKKKFSTCLFLSTFFYIYLKIKF
jgi:hypothetical protein